MQTETRASWKFAMKHRGVLSQVPCRSEGGLGTRVEGTTGLAVMRRKIVLMKWSNLQEPARRQCPHLPLLLQSPC